MFFPYRADLTLYRLPVVTIFISLLCLVVYTAQYSNQQAMVHSAERLCEAEPEAAFSSTLNQLFGRTDVATCMHLLLRTHLAPDKAAYLRAVAERVGLTPGVRHADLKDYYEEVLKERYREFARHAPEDLTSKLWYPPRSWNVAKMLTAAISHGSWMHVIGNLFFFFALEAAELAVRHLSMASTAAAFSSSSANASSLARISANLATSLRESASA